MAFTHLHVHTEYSLLDGAARIKEVVARAKELGMDSLAITDHGAMFGVIDFYKECKKQGIKPLIGCEVYMAARGMEDKDPDRDRFQNHLLLLAETNEGYRNLIKIVSAGFIRGMYYKPRVDKEELRKHRGGIIATSACLAGKVQQCLLDRDFDGAEQEARELDEIFGHGNFFLELQDQGLEEEQQINPELLKLSRKLDIPLVATNDVHYIRREDAEMHDVLLAIQTATTLDDEKRMRFPNDQFYLKSEDEMRKLFAFCPEACDNTALIAERCNVEFKFGEYHLPEFIPPAGHTCLSFMRELCEQGLEERYGHLPGGVTQEHRDRMEYELSVIAKMGYVEYYLIVWDFIHYAKSHGIMVGPGRGSGAASICAYCMHITDIDPIKYSLIFERFLNPERVSMPDFDIDFCIERRGEVIEYVKRKYGSANVSQIITFGTMKAKAAVRDVARAMGLTYNEADRIAKAIPFSLDMTLEKALAVSPDLKAMYESDPQVKRVVDMSKRIEGMPRNASTHAAGVVISKLPLDEYVPLYLSEKGVATQFNMTTVEELGLLKMDFLGLRNLTVIRDALELIKANHGVTVDFARMGYDDPAVYEMIAEGNTDGVFQLESQGMTGFMKNLHPTCFEDIVAGIALYRPGPMDSIPKYIENKKDPSHTRYVTPQLAPILDVTYGCLVYQEQVMQIVRDLAGYSYGRSDLVRRAMSKKKADVMAQEKQWFIYGKEREDGTVEVPGCLRNGITKDAAETIFADMESFASYAFNKAHAAAYAVVAFETGWLKRYYPVEFMAALMTSVKGDTSAVAKYIAACREMGIEVLPPSVNESERKFSVEGNKIRFGLQAVKNVGDNAIDAIIRVRRERGKFRDIFTLIDEIDTSVVNKKAMESLIKAGALDCLSPNRAAMLAVYDQLMDSAQASARNNLAGQMSLFQTERSVMETAAMSGGLPDVKNFDPGFLLALEKEYTGVYITDHPLNRYAKRIRRIVNLYTRDLSGTGEEGAGAEDGSGSPLQDGQRVILAGMVAGRRNLITKSSKMMAYVQLEDLYGTCEIIVFPNVLERFGEALTGDRVIVVTGRLDCREEEAPKVLAETIVAIDEYDESAPPQAYPRRDGNGYERSYGGRSGAGGSGGRENGRGYSGSDGASGSLDGRSHTGSGNGGGSGRLGNGNAGGSDNHAGAVKVRLPAFGSQEGSGGALSDEELLEELKKILRRYPGNREVLIYSRNGKVLSGGNMRVRPTLDFAEETALLVGNANIKIKEIAR